jgi:hypothetical protein
MPLTHRDSGASMDGANKEVSTLKNCNISAGSKDQVNSYLKISAMNEVFNPKVGLRALFSGPHWLAPYQLYCS